MAPLVTLLRPQPSRSQAGHPLRWVWSTRQRRRGGSSLLTLCFLVTLLVPALLLPASALAADGTITGQIVSKNGADNIAGLSVILEIATATGGQPVQRTASADADGRFRFDGVPIDAGSAYLLKVVYDGGNYFREAEFATGATNVDVGAIEVYRAVRSDTGISFSRMNSLMPQVDGTGAQLVETGGYLNDSDRAYIGRTGAQDATVVRFGLPVGAFNLNPATGLNRDTLVALDEAPLLGFATIEAVTPGDHQFAYTYQLQSQGGAITIDRIFPYRTDLYTLYLPPNARLESGGTSVLIRESGLQQLQNGQQFRVYTATNIPAGARLTAKLTNLPQPQSERNPLLPALMVFMFLLGVGLIVVYGRQRRRSPVLTAAQRQIKTVPGGVSQGKSVSARRAADDVPVSTTDLAARKEELLLALVELDERFESGELPEPEYRRLRKARKQELVGTLRALERQEAQPVASGAERDRP